MEVTYIGHAAILTRGAGRTILMDPWLEDPTYCDSWFHYPPLVHRVSDLLPVDWVYCSHDHLDHFDPPTLRQLPADQAFLVPQFRSGDLERKIRALGFSNIVPLEFDQPVELAPGLAVTCLRTDLVWEDSALIVESGGVTLFNMNDCKLGDELLAAVGRRFAPDIAFVPFSGAIHFPTCYDYPVERRRALCAARRQGHLEGFVHRIELLGAKRAVPFAGNFALLAGDQLWMNEPADNNINTPDQAIELLARELPQVEGLQMNPGDVWTRDGGLVRRAPPPDFAHKMEEIRALAAAAQPRIRELRSSEEPARSSLPEDVEHYFADICARHPSLPERIDARVVLDAEGEHGGVWCLEFTAAGFRFREFQAGQPWNMRMTLPAALLQQAVDRELEWDDVAISFRVRFAENPEFFNQDFWVMLYKSNGAFLGEYLADPAPKF